LTSKATVCPLGNKSNRYCTSSTPSRPIVNFGQILVLVVLLGLAAHAWPQSASSPPSTPAGHSALPEAPDTQTSVAQQSANAATLGSIHGVVINRDGSVYEGVQIALTRAGLTSRFAKTVTSDNNGRFNFTNVSPGPFQLTVSSNGFATQTISGILAVGQSYEAQAIVLPMSSAISEVTVTASTEQIAQEQVIQEEKQRVLGVIPNFYVAYAPNAAPLNSRQKFGLAWKSSIDPITILASAAFAGIEQARNSFSGYGQGAQGYAKRFGANYADTFIGGMIGGAILPSLLKQDPRYFYKGTGTIRSRALYAIATTVVCKGDNGRWQPNYSGIIGGLAAGGISNLYYPASNRDGATLTFENALTGIAGGAVQNLLQEFVIRRFTPKVPNYSPSNAPSN
jgi:hypothetical protein